MNHEKYFSAEKREWNREKNNNKHIQNVFFDVYLANTKLNDAGFTDTDIDI